MALSTCMTTDSVISSLRAVGFEPRFFQNRGQHGDELGTLKLLDRKIHGDLGQIEAFNLPGHDLTAGFAEHPTAKADDQSGFSATSMKRAGGTSPNSGLCHRTRASAPVSRPVSASTCCCRKTSEFAILPRPTQKIFQTNALPFFR